MIADARIGYVTVRAFHHNRDSSQRIVDRSANPQFAVDAAIVCRRSRQEMRVTNSLGCSLR